MARRLKDDLLSEPVRQALGEQLRLNQVLVVLLLVLVGEVLLDAALLGLVQVD